MTPVGVQGNLIHSVDSSKFNFIIPVCFVALCYRQKAREVNATLLRCQIRNKLRRKKLRYPWFRGYQVTSTKGTIAVKSGFLNTNCSIAPR